MLESLRKLLLAGLGTVDLTEEKLQAIINDLVGRGEVTQREGKEILSGWAKKASEQRAKLQEQVDDAVRRGLERVGLSHRAELERLEARIAELERRFPREPQPQ